MLAQVPDGATRSVLALASVENGWTSQLARVVTQYERSADDLDHLAAQWSTTTRKPTGREKARMQAALAAIVARAQAMLSTLD